MLTIQFLLIIRHSSFSRTTNAERTTLIQINKKNRRNKKRHKIVKERKSSTSKWKTKIKRKKRGYFFKTRVKSNLTRLLLRSKEEKLNGCELLSFLF
jgi:Flp pilus assembly protein TadB